MIGKLPAYVGRGTGYMIENVLNRFFSDLTNLHRYNWVVLPGESDEDEELTKRNDTIVWLHVPTLYAPEWITKYFYDKSLTKNIKAYIVQSEFHKKDIIDNFGADPKKVFVLNNSFDQIDYVEKSKFQINFIYTSQESRGLDILVEAFAQINDPAIKLIVHGCGCIECTNGLRLPEDDRIIYFGQTDRDQYVSNLQKSHILAYPSRFEETAGIAIMEAMSAGLKIVTTDLGALPETTLGFAKIIKGFPIETYRQNAKKKKYIRLFRKAMIKAIDEVRSGKFDPLEQVSAVNNRFNWNVIEKQWIDFNSRM